MLYKNQIKKLNAQVEDLRLVISKSDSIAEKQFKTFAIDEELEKCTTENFMTVSMNTCTNKGIEAWNKEITNYLKQLERYLDNDKKQLLVDTQAAWEIYYKKEQDFLNNTVAQKDGDIHTTFVVGDLYEITKQRALSLKSYLLQIKNQ